MRNTINSTKMKENNIRLVMATVRNARTISRKDLAQITGMTQPSITNIINQLISEGYIEEIGNAESSGGRKPVLLDINPKAGFVIGIELTVKEIHCIITDFKVRILYQTAQNVQISDGKEAVLRQVIDVIESVIDKAGITRNSIKGIGLVSAGPCDYEHGIMINPPNFPGWRNVPIKQIVQDAVNLEVFFEKETPAATLAELWFGEAKKAKSLFLTNIFEVGIGSGLVLDGTIYHGFHDGAGEIGHIMIDPDGIECSCGSKGCLEAMADGNATFNRWKARVRNGEAALAQYGLRDIEDADFGFFLNAAEAGDTLCREEICRSAYYIGIAISSVINLYSPDTIVLAGDFANRSELLVSEIIRNVCSKPYLQHVPSMSIYHSKLGSTISALGGVAIVLERFFK